MPVLIHSHSIRNEINPLASALTLQIPQGSSAAAAGQFLSALRVATGPDLAPVAAGPLAQAGTVAAVPVTVSTAEPVAPALGPLAPSARGTVAAAPLLLNAASSIAAGTISVAGTVTALPVQGVVATLVPAGTVAPMGPVVAGPGLAAPVVAPQVANQGATQVATGTVVVAPAVLAADSLAGTDSPVEVAAPMVPSAPVAVVAKAPPAVKGAVPRHEPEKDQANVAGSVPAVPIAPVPVPGPVPVPAAAEQAAMAIATQGTAVADPVPSPPASAESLKTAVASGGATAHADTPVPIPEAIPEASVQPPVADAKAPPAVQTEAAAPVIQVKVQRQADASSSTPAETVTVAETGGAVIRPVSVAMTSDRPETSRGGAEHEAPATASAMGPVADQAAPVAVTPDASMAAALVLPVAAEPVVTTPAVTSTVTVPASSAPELAATAMAAAHPSAAGQIGPALLTLATAADGTQQMTLRLQPEELGTVQVRIDRAPDGTSQVNITADNPSTLQAITSEQSDLHKALDAAGIPATGRTVTFGLTQEGAAPATPVGITANQTREDASAQQQSMAGGGPGGGAMSQGSSGGGASQQGGGQSAYRPVFEVPAGGFSESLDSDADISS